MSEWSDETLGVSNETLTRLMVKIRVSFVKEHLCHGELLCCTWIAFDYASDKVKCLILLQCSRLCRPRMKPSRDKCQDSTGISRIDSILLSSWYVEHSQKEGNSDAEMKPLYSWLSQSVLSQGKDETIVSLKSENAMLRLKLAQVSTVPTQLPRCETSTFFFSCPMGFMCYMYSVVCVHRLCIMPGPSQHVGVYMPNKLMCFIKLQQGDENCY